MRLILLLLRPIYYLLYHQFAWSYDLVADVVSLGQWQAWVLAALPRLEGRVLELGFGPGHLQEAMQKKGIIPFGMDESRFMASRAGRRLKKAGHPRRLARGLAQSMPYPAGSFQCVVSTFPAEYIFDPRTMDEARRVLQPGGKLIIVPLAWLTGIRPLDRFVAWIMRVTGEAPGKPAFLPAPIRERFISQGFDLRQEIITLPKSKALLLEAIMENNAPQS